MATKITAHGASGAQYSFNAMDGPAGARAIPAVYMFACRAIGGWKIVFVGECADLKSCLSNRESWDEAVRCFGATHILAYSASRNEAARRRVQRDLVLAQDPVMNISYQPSASYAK